MVGRFFFINPPPPNKHHYSINARRARAYATGAKTIKGAQAANAGLIQIRDAPKTPNPVVTAKKIPNVTKQAKDN
jgi:hypothetical protein